jgi:hypothetical protein
MQLKRVVVAFLVAIIFTSLSGGKCLAATPDKYTDGKLTVEWTQTGDNFSGTITLGEQQYPASAHRGSDGITGSFVAGAHPFPFTASLNGDTLTFVTGPKQYILKNTAAPANPLAGDDQSTLANPLAATTAPTSDAPAGYAIVSSSEFGTAISVQKAGAASVQSALQATLPDLAAYFGSKPTIGSAYQDAKDPKSGGATFSAALNGQPMKGIISCKVGDKGAAVAVIYAKADAPKSEWDKLMAPQQARSDSASQGAAATPAKPPVPLTEFDFPDGTGSVQLADGWKTPSTTCVNAVVIAGPAKQSIIMNNSVMIETPDSPTQKMKRQNQEMMARMNANARAAGRPPIPPFPPGPPSLVAPYCEPEEALKTMLPQFSKISEFNHGPSTKLDKIISVKEVPPLLQGAKSAIIAYAYTQTSNGEVEHYRRSIYLTTCPMNAGTWTWRVTGVAAPDATYDHDAPVMFAMVNSLKVNEAQFTQVLNAQTQNNIQAIQTLGAAENKALATQAQIGRDNMNTQNEIHQEQHQAQMDGYHQHNEQWAADETAKQQRNADFIETIQGTRTIYDTQTGAVGSAELTSATAVVDSLNQAALDPNRFVQIPLRDYLYAPTPVPSR